MKNYKLWFWIFFILSVITADILLLQNKKLKTETASKGIVSLELGNSFERDTAIVASWRMQPQDTNLVKTACKEPAKPNLLSLAKTNTYIDFIFICFYVLFGIILISWLQSRASKQYKLLTGSLITITIIAGIMDMLENIGMLRLIAAAAAGTLNTLNKSIFALPFIPAYIKFILLIALVFIYLPVKLILDNRALETITAFIGRRTEQLYRYRVIFIGTFIFALPIWMLDQGQDLLINITGSGEELGVVLLLAMILAAAFLNWYFAKLFFSRNYQPPVFPFREPVANDFSEKKVSRFLGVLTIILPATAILNTLKATHVGYTLDFFSPLTWLVVLTGTFYTLIKYDLACVLYSKIKNKKTALFILWTLIILLTIAIPLIVRFTYKAKGTDPDSLAYLYWHMLFLAFAFYIFVSIRNNVFSTGLFGNHIGKLVFWLSILICLFFLLLNFAPGLLITWDKPFLTLPSLLAGLVFYIFIFTILIRLSQWKKINFLAFIFIIGMVLSLTNTNNYHSAQTISLPTGKPTRSPELKDYFRQWVLDRADEIRKDSSYPVFIVNTYGGGIKAAAFTSMTLAFLDSIVTAKTNGGDAFMQHTFSLSGASGGTIGAAIQCAYRNKYGNQTGNYSIKRFSDFYSHDFLAAVLVSNLGRDLLASGTTLDWWGDRSKVQEHLWSAFAREELGIDIGTEYDAAWKNPGPGYTTSVPLLFSNTLNVDDGLKGICAPVHLTGRDFPATIFIKDILDSMNLRSKDISGISLVTGAFLSARFPFISPSGKMGPGFHFIDGGGKDNSGASTSDLIFAAIGRYSEQAIKENKDTTFTNLLKHVRFYFISISHSPERTEPRKLVENRFELLSPVIGIVNSGIDGNAHAADESLFRRYGAADSLTHFGYRTDYIPVFPSADCDSTDKDYQAILPLGWQISQPALDRLELTFRRKEAADSMGLRKILRIMQSE